MKRGIIISIILFSNLIVCAQVRTVTIENGRAVNDTLFDKQMFYLKDFVKSRITLTDGTMHTATANISTIDQITYIIENGDTTRVLQEKDIAIFSGGGALIYKIDGTYHQLLETDGDISLMVAKVVKFEGEKLIGAYGGSSETAAISKISDAHSALFTEGYYDRWKWGGDMIVEMKYEYKEYFYLISKGKRYIPTKKNFEKLFGKQKADIAKFLNNNEQQLSKNENIIRLFKHLVE